ncbi:Rcf2p [Sugiyamaella lignohabitans]|uniref:Rcf2p n=1 Tax=Sugiyamaella lignohabitans TaxID=796027 RepID=A0A167E7L7_9ASCO|nr:Rcf2p [Sugiyamaella lignohabitans]ANB13740.1 Rcf2p [Sugiyamaella lignohabitans]
MKFPSKEELNEYTHTIAVGAIKGAVIGTGVSALGYLYAKRRAPVFFTYGAFPRTFLLIAPPIMIGVTTMEFASREFERERYGYVDAASASPDMLIPKINGSNIDPKLAAKVGANGTDGAAAEPNAVLQYAAENKYKIIMGAWAASLAGSYWAVSKDKYLTKSQRIVQARMYAQGLTVALLLVSVMLSVSNGKEKDNSRETGEADLREGKQTWEEIVEQETARETAAHLPLHLSDRKNNGNHHHD